MNARLLLALIELEIGRPQRAVQALRANLDQIADPRTVRLMMLSCVESQHQGTAAQWAGELFALSNAWLDDTAELTVQTTLADSDAVIPTEPVEEHVHALAGELLDNEAVIPSLVVAARHEQPTRATLLLRRALASIVHELEDGCAGFEALAYLAAHAGDEEEARHWARRGLSAFPTSAPLALLLAKLPTGKVRLQIQPAFLTTGHRSAGRVRLVPRPARIEPDLELAEQQRALDVVIRAHPDWPDVREARFELTSSMSEAA
jgi:hypothetical protein